jgi:hypothetical protein
MNKIKKHVEYAFKLAAENPSFSSSEIAKMVKERFPDITEESMSRRVRMIRQHNTFHQKLEENNFTPPENWSHGWLKTKEASVFIRNQSEFELTEEFVKETITAALINVKPVSNSYVPSGNKKALRGIITDAHVGMNPMSEDALFSFRYDEIIFKEHLDVFFNHMKKEIHSHGFFDVIIVDDLGDGLDGFNGTTTRASHHLEQNMSNKEAWSAYVFNKLNTLCSIINLNAAEKYQFRNVANCNHAGDFGWTANMAIKMTLEKMYENVEYIILNKPIEHFTYGNHTYLITHGKDKNLMTKGMPLHLTDKTAGIIRQYIDHYGITSPYIHVDKGDLHRVAYDRNPRFDYRNFMSFAPPSQWVQANYGVSYCGFSTQIIPKHTNDIQHTDIFFDMKKS